MKILLTGGGSGGHITPLIAVVQSIKKTVIQNNLGQVEFVFIGPTARNEFFEELMAREGIKVINISAGKFRRYFSWTNLADWLFKIPYSFLQALWFVFWNMPDIVFSKGGYGSVPVVYASRFYFLPVVLHESDAVMGLANKLAMHKVQLITLGFKGIQTPVNPKKSLFAGNPIRSDLASGSKEIGKEIFKVSGKKPVLLIITGSQGAEFINDTILNNLEIFVKQYDIIHVTGPSKYEQIPVELEARFGKSDFAGYHPYPFLMEEMKHAYAVADVVISRCGANSIAEIAANGKPSILIPLKTSAQNHQQVNAYLYGRSGAAIIIEEDNLLPHLLLRDLNEITTNTSLRKAMIKAALAFNPPDSSDIIARQILLKAGIDF